MFVTCIAGLFKPNFPFEMHQGISIDNLRNYEEISLSFMAA